ncbi:ethanolamine ammonia-lyase subunit EutB [Flagellimonas aequoris]|uniref:Ethanolamine ammonia-lyase large subunit n=1 Tax=Flagellimonas aequoris TaxID=2306997 RepID=A0A418N7A7_9FLAO|nr:ethanolamine ammonia-lyase subunit EutB [Allomuricauda aequoris]RIV70715.1 ethanolamine ammonia-lyase subunit EutB [Allomuricauda aequoris]TXK02153.1 ethanolamine ammonia-lyase subunit EutB [Allomuricauda aequoris]
MSYSYTIQQHVYSFPDLKSVLAKASPFRTGDALSGLAAESNMERVAAQFVLSEIALKDFLNEAFIPYEEDEVTRLIMDTHDNVAFQEISGFTVGGLRNWLLSHEVDSQKLAKIAKALTPEMVAAVSKLMRNQDLISVAQKCEVITQFRNTIGKKGHLSVRLQPNHPTDDLRGVAASIVDGLLYGSGDAVIGINPVTDSVDIVGDQLKMMDEIRQRFDIPTQICVLCHLTTSLELLDKSPVDLVFQSIGGTEKTNASFGINLSMLQEAYEGTLQLNRGTLGNNLMYFETGQGSSLSANAHWGVDQQTCETRAYAVARHFNPLLVNSVVGFIGPEYLYDGKQITRAGLEDHFCGKLMGLPMGMDVCYTNHAEADQDDMDNLLTLLGVAGCNFIMGVPGSDDVMLNYQSTSFHDALYVRKVLNKKPAPEFETWLHNMGILDDTGNRLTIEPSHRLLKNL